MNPSDDRRVVPPSQPFAAALINAACGSLALGATPAAFAEGDERRDRNREIETVYVIETARAASKMTAPTVNTPQTIAVVPSEVFNAQGAQNLTDVLRNTPGITFNAGENGFATDTNNFSLRGFETSGNVFIDGSRDSGNYGRDVFNLQHVEVAKGPAADNGRGAAGGYVNIVTKTPTEDAFARGMASYGADRYGADDRVRATFDLNRPIGEGTAVRLNLLAQSGGVAGREHAEKESWGFAPSIAFGLDGDTQVTLSLQHLDQSGRPDWGIPGAMIEGTFRFDADAASASRDNFYGLLSDYDDVTSTSALVRIEHDFAANFYITNQTRWATNEREAAYTVPTGYTAATALVATQLQAFSRETDTLTNLTNVGTSFTTGRVAHTLVAGFELSREESSSGRFGTTNADTTSVFAPDPARASLAPPAASQSSTVEIDTAAVYVYDTMELSDRWQLTGGLRAESYDVTLGSRDLATGLPTGPDGYEVGESTLSGKLGIVFKPADNGSVYAAVGVSSLPPGSYLSNPDISRTGDNAFPGLVGQNNEAADVQRAVNYELGTKWELAGGRLSWTAAYFHTERRKVAITGVTPGVPDSPVTLQGYGEQVVQGIELGASGALTENWQIFAGVLLMDSERKHSAYLDAARRLANPGDYGPALTTNGDQLSFTPRRSASLWTTYALPFGLTLGGGVQHVGDSFAGRPDDADRIIPNGTFGKLPGYTVTSLMAAYAASEKLFVRFNVDNVADELYAVSMNWPAQRVLLGPPRSFLLSADYRF